MMALQVYSWAWKSFVIIVIFISSSVAVEKSSVLDEDYDDDVYPHSIPVYPVRLDPHTNLPVSRGRFHAFDRHGPHEIVNDPTKKTSVTKFKEILQCAKSEPTINGARGIIDMLKMLPPTRAITELVCTKVETGCNPWSDCHAQLKRKQNASTNECHRTPEVNLIRVINGSLFVDWPWCFSGTPFTSMTILIQHVLSFVNDLQDSVFLVGPEQSKLPWNVPFPLISNSPDFHFSDIPWPWIESLRTEFELYNKAKETKDFHLENYRRPFVPHYLEWNQKISKAAYFGEMINIRQIFFDQALLRPDLIEARWKCDFCATNPWNPLSSEKFSELYKINGETDPPIHYSPKQTDNMHISKDTVGFLEPLHWSHISVFVNDVAVGKYKYLVVLTGINGKAASGRLASFLAYSGAVLLLQLNEFEYHFSARLKPWVHYVPLSYSAADVVAKIEWLRAHDDLAKQIAENARNFGLSYLRLEDQFCYVATALETFAELVKGTDATVPWNPQPLASSRRELQEILDEMKFL